jgi:hypothetical protein
MAQWIQKAIKHPGGLHRALHVPEGEKIPAKKVAKASHSDNPRLRRMANLAKTLKGLAHKSEGGRVEKVLAEGDQAKSRADRPSRGK